ncbi:MAG TPA: methylenetetrahydrofolate reductase [Spirochaetia bacterium]|nr:methylenetetrahydrofolate reductase [Spirochaetia bacterium]
MAFSDSPYIIELLTPKQSDQSIEEKLQEFARRYARILQEDATVSICDNPLGNIHFTAMEVVSFLDLSFVPERTLLHLNSFHRKVDFDDFLRDARDRGLKYILVVSGDGSPRLPRLEPAQLGVPGKTVTSVEMLRYIEREHPGHFTCGVAFNQYEPLPDEREKLRRKIEAGARFVITQPVIGREESVATLEDVGVPVFVGAWMSKRIEPLCECVGVRKPDTARYDPVENLTAVQGAYPGFGIYLAQLGFKREWGSLLTRAPHAFPATRRTLVPADRPRSA